MVKTRAQTSQSNQNRKDDAKVYDDNSNNVSLSELGMRSFEIDNNADNYRKQERDHDEYVLNVGLVKWVDISES